MGSRIDIFTIGAGAAAIGLGVLVALIAGDHVGLGGGWLAAIGVAAVGLALTLGDSRPNRR